MWNDFDPYVFGIFAAVTFGWQNLILYGYDIKEVIRICYIILVKKYSTVKEH